MQNILEYVTEQLKREYEDDDFPNLFIGEIHEDKNDAYDGICDIPGCNQDRTSSVEFDFCYGDDEDGDYEGIEQYLYVCLQHYFDIQLEAAKVEDKSMGRSFS